MNTYVVLRAALPTTKLLLIVYIGKKDTRLEVLTAVLLKTPVFRNVTPCRSENMYESFFSAYILKVQDFRP